MEKKKKVKDKPEVSTVRQAFSVIRSDSAPRVFPKAGMHLYRAQKQFSAERLTIPTD